MASLSDHLNDLAKFDKRTRPNDTYNDFLMSVVHEVETPDGKIQYTAQDLLLEAGYLLGGKDHHYLAFKGVLLGTGNRYRFRHVSGRQKRIRETVATYLGQDERNLILSGRGEDRTTEGHHFGTSYLPKTWVLSIEEVEKSVPIRANRVTDELRVEAW